MQKKIPLILTFLMLSGCFGREVALQEKVVYQSLPKALLSDCKVVDMQEAMTLEELAQNASEALLGQYKEVAKCNSRLKQAREIQDNREKIYGNPK